MKAVPARPASILPNRLHQRLDAYALAATATGVGMLALAQPAEAKIVYTPTHRNLILGQPFPLDLNHDGIVDFFLLDAFTRTQYDHFLSACQSVSNYGGPYHCLSKSVNLVKASSNGFAAALRRGKKIESRNHFVQVGEMGDVEFPDNHWFGPWVDDGKGVRCRYLGLKFDINGRYHFGWARLTVLTKTGNDFTATLTGYAYETIPGKGIVAGQTKGPVAPTGDSAASTSPQNTSLGALAAGVQNRPKRRGQPNPQE